MCSRTTLWPARALAPRAGLQAGAGAPNRGRRPLAGHATGGAPERLLVDAVHIAAQVVVQVVNHVRLKHPDSCPPPTAAAAARWLAWSARAAVGRSGPRGAAARCRCYCRCCWLAGLCHKCFRCPWASCTEQASWRTEATDERAQWRRKQAWAAPPPPPLALPPQPPGASGGIGWVRTPVTSDRRACQVRSSPQEVAPMARSRSAWSADQHALSRYSRQRSQA